MHLIGSFVDRRRRHVSWTRSSIRKRCGGTPWRSAKARVRCSRETSEAVGQLLHRPVAGDVLPQQRFGRHRQFDALALVGPRVGGLVEGGEDRVGQQHCVGAAHLRHMARLARQVAQPLDEAVVDSQVVDPAELADQCRRRCGGGAAVEDQAQELPRPLLSAVEAFPELRLLHVPQDRLPRPQPARLGRLGVGHHAPARQGELDHHVLLHRRLPDVVDVVPLAKAKP